eukprot:1161467-Pelagomonas_calceolata.AAC.6
MACGDPSVPPWPSQGEGRTQLGTRLPPPQKNLDPNLDPNFPECWGPSTPWCNRGLTRHLLLVTSQPNESAMLHCHEVTIDMMRFASLVERKPQWTTLLCCNILAKM